MKFPRDYEITIKADTKDDVYWYMTHKGERRAMTDEDKPVIVAMLKDLLHKLL